MAKPRVSITPLLPDGYKRSDIPMVIVVGLMVGAVAALAGIGLLILGY